MLAEEFVSGLGLISEGEGCDFMLYLVMMRNLQWRNFEKEIRVLKMAPIPCENLGENR